MVGKKRAARRLRFVSAVLFVIVFSLSIIALIGSPSPTVLFSNQRNDWRFELEPHDVRESPFFGLWRAGKLTFDGRVNSSNPDEPVSSPPPNGDFFEITSVAGWLSINIWQCKTTEDQGDYTLRFKASYLYLNLRPWAILFMVALLFCWGWGIVQRRRIRPWECKHCGYNLTGLVSDRCPECGAAVPERRAGSGPAVAEHTPPLPRARGIQDGPQ